MTEQSHSDDESPAKSSKNITERILQLVTLAAGLIALPVAILRGRPASAVAALVAAGAGVGLLIAHVWQARLPSGEHRYSWLRWFTVAAAAMLIALLAAVNINVKSRSEFIHGMLGFHKQAEPYRYELVFATSEKYYRIQIPISNYQAQDDQVNSLTLTIEWNSDTRTTPCAGTPSGYQLKDHIVITKSGNIVNAPLRALSGALAGFLLPATGSFGEVCEGGGLDLTFNPGLIVKGNSTTLLYVDVPKLIHATSWQTGFQNEPDFTSKTGNFIADATAIPDPVNGGTGSTDEYSFVMVQSNVNFISGKTYSSCTIIKGIYASPPVSDGSCP